MARDEVAPGDGALRQCSTRPATGPALSGAMSKTKSSTSWPAESMAWARTPAGPLRSRQQENQTTGTVDMETEEPRQTVELDGGEVRLEKTTRSNGRVGN